MKSKEKYSVGILQNFNAYEYKILYFTHQFPLVIYC
jgi:hypothetical protein